jgi:hypothetical protein
LWSNDSRRISTFTFLIEKAQCDPRESRRSIGCGRPGQCDTETVRLFGEFTVEVPDHLDMVGDKPDRADDDSLGSCFCQSGKVIGDIGF